MSDKAQMVTFPRELSDDLAELISEKARVCGGGAFEIWEAICERFGQSAPDKEDPFAATEAPYVPLSAAEVEAFMSMGDRT